MKPQLFSTNVGSGFAKCKTWFLIRVMLNRRDNQQISKMTAFQSKVKPPEWHIENEVSRSRLPKVGSPKRQPKM